LSTNFTLAQLAALDAAIAQGVLKVRYSSPSGDKELIYQSRQDMLATRDLMRKELGITSPQAVRILPSFSKGF
jgi:hypothetical protein